MNRSVVQTQREVKANDPAIKANQVWVARNSKRQIVRRIRILAEMPKPTGISPRSKAWIFQELSSKMRFGGELGICPEFNLRYVFRLHKETYP